MRKEFEGTKEKPTPVKNEEIRHTTSQTGSHVPVSLTDVTEELGEEVEAPLQDAEWDHNKVVKTEVQQNSNCYNFQDHWVEEDQTPTPTKQAPRRQQVLRYLNIKFYAPSTSSSTLPQYQVLRYLNQNAKCRRRRRGCKWIKTWRWEWGRK